MKYLFENWQTLKPKLLRKNIFLFLDYDGTLTPIVSTPDEAETSEEVRRLLGKLSKNPRIKLAIISGRNLKDVKKMVGVTGIIYSGNHGLETRGLGIKLFKSSSARAKAAIQKVKLELKKHLKQIKGVLLEDKKLSLSVHYRLTTLKDSIRVIHIVSNIANPYISKGIISLKPGKKVIEVRPTLNWDKGKIVSWLLSRNLFGRTKRKIYPVYIGDDITDEDAFKTIGSKGLTVCVGNLKKSSNAEFYVRNTKEVHKLLHLLIKEGDGG